MGSNSSLPAPPSAPGATPTVGFSSSSLSQGTFTSSPPPSPLQATPLPTAPSSPSQGLPPLLRATSTATSSSGLTPPPTEGDLRFASNHVVHQLYETRVTATRANNGSLYSQVTHEIDPLAQQIKTSSNLPPMQRAQVLQQSHSRLQAVRRRFNQLGQNLFDAFNVH